MARKKENGEMMIKRIIVGPLETNCYIVADKKTREAAIIDPGDEPGKIFNAIKENNLNPKFILLTHEHPDHIGALEKIEELCEVRLLAVKDGDELRAGNLEIKVMATPGHAPESACFIVYPEFIEGAGNIFSGDTLFKHGVGRTDLPGGDYGQIKKSLKRLTQFPDDFNIWPGHGPETTIGEERRNNPFLTF